jgi:hypothetical protein
MLLYKFLHNLLYAFVQIANKWDYKKSFISEKRVTANCCHPAKFTTDETTLLYCGGGGANGNDTCISLSLVNFNYQLNAQINIKDEKCPFVRMLNYALCHEDVWGVDVPRH